MKIVLDESDYQTMVQVRFEENQGNRLGNLRRNKMKIVLDESEVVHIIIDQAERTFGITAVRNPLCFRIFTKEGE